MIEYCVYLQRIFLTLSRLVQEEQVERVQVLLEIDLKCFNRSKERLEGRANILDIRVSISSELEFQQGVREFNRLIEEVLERRRCQVRQLYFSSEFENGRFVWIHNKDKAWTLFSEEHEDDILDDLSFRFRFIDPSI